MRTRALRSSKNATGILNLALDWLIIIYMLTGMFYDYVIMCTATGCLRSIDLHDDARVYTSDAADHAKITPYNLVVGGCSWCVCVLIHLKQTAGG